MRSNRADPRRLAACVAAAALLAGGPGFGRAQAALPPHASSASAPAGTSSAAIRAAVAKLNDDPLLLGRHKTHELQWKPEPRKTKKPESDPSWLQWFASLARFVNDASRFLVYGTVLVLAAVLLVSGRHLIQVRAFRRRAAIAAAVSHVGALDVRPESLPDDIGAAAWTLWQAGQAAAALSLLYRGALSRLIHRWQVPITASTTEGECLALAHGTLAPAAQRYLTQLVRAWEASIYGKRALPGATGEALCSGFAARLDAAAPAEDAA